MIDPAITAQAAEEDKRKTRVMRAVRPTALPQGISLEHVALGGARLKGKELVLELEGHDSPYKASKFDHPGPYSYGGLLLRNGLPAKKAVALMVRGRAERFDVQDRLEEHPEILAQIVSDPAYQGRRITLYTLLGDNPYLFDPSGDTMTVYGKLFTDQLGLVTFHKSQEAYGADEEQNASRKVVRALIPPHRLMAYSGSVYTSDGRLLLRAHTSRERFAEFGFRVLTPQQFRDQSTAGNIQQVVYRSRVAEILENKPVER